MRPATLAAALLLAFVAGCSGGGDANTPGDGEIPLPPLASDSPATSAPAAAGVVYTLSGELCEKADQSPLVDLYPKEDAARLVNTEKLCVTRRTSTERSVSLTIDADLLQTEAAAKLFVETGRRLAKRPYTDVDGAGTDAFWSSDKDDVKLTSYHGNLVLEVEAAVNVADGMPADIVPRLVRIAAGTYAKLAP
ncbi:hypothetical protein [Phytohabitans rumicis]|uniref:Lipoprotein n=1 Tax=Phytohabitans rumicis TaxID=1076125 RepID=A0A6V8L3N1_9ACTN|nr:hypothetical protein [Phytohabitans rumicis]GFJ88746.1 hypothetical protein Prum_023880 [Phytohabitans rumicis]